MAEDLGGFDITVKVDQGQVGAAMSAGSREAATRIGEGIKKNGQAIADRLGRLTGLPLGGLARAASGVAGASGGGGAGAGLAVGAGAAAGRAAGGAAAGAAAAAGPAIIAAAVLLAANEIKDLVKDIADRVRRVMASVQATIERLARVSPAVSMARAQQMLSGTRRDIASGQVLGGDISRMVGAQERMRDAIRPITDAIRGVVIRVLTGIFERIGSIFEMVNSIVSAIRSVAAIRIALEAMVKAVMLIAKILSLMHPLVAIIEGINQIQQNTRPKTRVDAATESNRRMTADLEMLTGGAWRFPVRFPIP